MKTHSPLWAFLFLASVMAPSILGSLILIEKLLPKPRYRDHDGTAYYHTCQNYTARNLSRYQLPCGDGRSDTALAVALAHHSFPPQWAIEEVFP